MTLTKTENIMETKRQKFQKFTASFSIGEAIGTMTFETSSFDRAITLLEKVINGRGEWSLIWDEEGNELHNPNADWIITE